jgi:hypothetical protein
MGPTLGETTAERIEDPSVAEGQAYVLDFDEFGIHRRHFGQLCLRGRFGEAFQGRSSDSEQFKALAVGLH